MYQFLFNCFVRSLPLVLVMLLVCCQTLLGQSTVDSLRAALKGTSGEARLQLLTRLSAELTDKNNKESFDLAHEAYELALEVGDSLQLVKSLRLKGQLYRRFDRLETSIQLSLQALPIARRNRMVDEEKRILNSLAIAYSFRAEYDEALKYHFQSLVIRERENKKDEIGIALNNIGFVYFKLKDYERAIEYYKQVLDLIRAEKIDFELDRVLINVGLCYNQLKNYREARVYIKEGFEYCGTNCRTDVQIEGNFGLANSYFIEGEVNKSREAYLEARNYHTKAYNIARKTGEKRWQLETLVYIARIDTRLNEPARAEQALHEAERLAQGTEYNLLLTDIYKGFSTLYNQTKSFEKAAFYQDRYIHLKDSIYGETLINNLSKIQTQFEERKNIATIAANKVAMKQQRDLNVAVAVIALMAGLLILVQQRGNRNIKRVNARLSEAKETIQEQNKLLETQNRFLDKEVEIKNQNLRQVNKSLKQVNEELDNFIYKTSHDIRGPLASLKGMCNVALMDVKDATARDYLHKLDATAERLNGILTRLLIINQINNSKLSVSRIDLNSIVSEVIQLEHKKGYPKKVELRSHLEGETLIVSDRTLIRIVLENLVDNAIKFYNDSDRVNSFVDIYVDMLENNHARVRVVDNGIGISEVNPGKLFRMFFRASERSETGGIGLYIVKTAMTKLGGDVGLSTTPEGHTEFYITLPPQPPTNPDEALEGTFY